MVGDIKIMMLGLIQSMFEGAMFTFVFMWTPALSRGAVNSVELPHGWIFASFMMSVMLGSTVFKILVERYRLESMMRVVFLISCASLSVPIFFENQTIVLAAFLTFESTVGVFWPAMGTMRSKYIPEESRATIMNFFRIPLNAIVVLVLFNVGNLDTTLVFVFCSFFLFASSLCQQVLFNKVVASPIQTTSL